MTINEFLKELAEVPVKWKLSGEDVYTAIRCNKYKCPIEALARYKFGFVGPVVCAGARLKLSPETIEKIMDAADDTTFDDESKELRKKLLVACKLNGKDKCIKTR